MDRNRRFAELCGIDWRKYRPLREGETILPGDQCLDPDKNAEWHMASMARSIVPSPLYPAHCQYRRMVGGTIPDFTSDPRLVLEAMRKREDWKEFVSEIGIVFYRGDGGEEELEWDATTDVDLILDRTGKLLDIAIEWMEGKGK